MKFKKILFLFDMQIPYQINLSPLLKFKNDFKPDILVFGGDILDCEGLFGWHNKTLDKIMWGINNKLLNEIIIANKILDSFLAHQNPRELYWWMGNHEQRLEDVRNYYPQIKKLVPPLSEYLGLNTRGFKIYKQNDVVKFGKLGVFHGDDYSTFHTRKNVTDYECNLLYGHVHTPQLFTKVSPVRSQPHIAMSAPCLCSKNPEWKEGKPNSWVNGFVYGYIRDDGNFNIYPVFIIKNKFIVNGTIYE